EEARDGLVRELSPREQRVAGLSDLPLLRRPLRRPPASPGAPTHAPRHREVGMPELDRREFLKVVGASAGAAATAGCSDPVDKLIPYLVQPEEITPGIPLYYASTCLECPVGCGLHVKTREGRPIKLEGNPEHPVNRGALCARGQASIGRTYHPDRFAGPMRRGANGELEPIAWDEAIALLAA